MWNRIGFASILIFLVLSMFMLMRLLEGQSTQQVDPASLSPIKHVIKNAPITKPVFFVYYPINNEKKASSLGEELARKLEGLHEYSAVEVTYYLGVSDKTMKLQKGEFDLFRVKPDFEKSLPEDIVINRTPIASYAGYPVYYISKDSMPKLDGSYLSGKSLGLIADVSSESGHKYPIKALKNIRKESLPIIKSIYAGHDDLRHALQKGEVDLIGSYWNDAQHKEHPGWYSLKIADIPKGDTWFLELDDHQSDIVCKVSEALKNIAENQSEEYWKNIIDLTECNEPHE